VLEHLLAVADEMFAVENRRFHKLCMVHDKLNNVTMEWKPPWARDYRRYAQPYDTPEVIAWDGLLLDGGLALQRLPRQSFKIGSHDFPVVVYDVRCVTAARDDPAGVTKRL